MNNLVVGTAGHIDHGKSSLVRALTGIDPDRLKEEKARGITIELGLRAHDDRRHARRVCRRAGPRAIRAHDAGRRRRHRLRAADRRGRRIGDAADARALRHLPPAAHSARHRRADQVGSRRRRHARAGAAGRRGAGQGIVPRVRAGHRGVGDHRRRPRSHCATRLPAQAAQVRRAAGRWRRATADRSRVLDEGLRHRRDRDAGRRAASQSTTSWSCSRAAASSRCAACRCTAGRRRRPWPASARRSISAASRSATCRAARRC